MDLPFLHPSIHRDVTNWYRTHGRDLPWRLEPLCNDPYALLVSEIMLQQTQVDRVIPKYLQFIQLFPNWHQLANAPQSEVVRAWSSLGYNQRSVRLHKVARLVVNLYSGNLPRDFKTLMTLPGIGSYTASAMACFAFGARITVLDTNIYRVFGRIGFGVIKPRKDIIDRMAWTWLPDSDFSQWHQALMDIGATICTVRKPDCPRCPVRDYCKAAPEFSKGKPIDSTDRTRKQPPFKNSARYYRGRIIEKLREVELGTSISLEELGCSLFGQISSSQSVWLKALIDGLVKDELVSLEVAPNNPPLVSLL